VGIIVAGGMLEMDERRRITHVPQGQSSEGIPQQGQGCGRGPRGGPTTTPESSCIP